MKNKKASEQEQKEEQEWSTAIWEQQEIENTDKTSPTPQTDFSKFEIWCYGNNSLCDW